MDQGLRRQAEELYQAAAELGPEQREQLLRERCSGNPALLVEVEQLLGYSETEMGDFLQASQARHAEGATQTTPSRLPAVETDPLIGSQIGKHELLRRIHSGGQGVVYQGVHTPTGRKVAVKIMRTAELADERHRIRFEREGKILAALDHPNIVTVIDSGSTADGTCYLITDYVSGQHLDEWAAAYRKGHAPDSKALRGLLEMFAKVCDAVHAAHLQGIVHRDLKPSNIVIDANGEPHILDFGIAHISMPHFGEAGRHRVATVTGQFLGSLPWASPEQAEGIPGKIDIRTDVYSAGMILFQMLTGEFPYEVTGSIREALDTILSVEPARPRTLNRQVDSDLETIVLKCLAKERERRYQSAGELARDIRHYLVGEPIEAKRDNTLYVLRKSLERHRRGLATTTLIAVIATLSVSAVITEHRRSAAQEHAARLVTDAQQFIWQRKELTRAFSLLDEALDVAPGFGRAYTLRGFANAIAGLQVEHGAKGYYVERALSDFEHANVVAGGTPALGRLSGEWRGTLGNGPALWAAADLLRLSHREDEADALVTLLVARQADVSAASGHLPPVYDQRFDPLVSAVPSGSPSMSLMAPDINASIHRVLPASVESLNPISARSYGLYITELLFDTLFVVDAQMQCRANSALVEAISREGNVWSIQLKPGLTWHDGQPFTAHDVEFTWRTFFADESDALEDVIATNERVVQLSKKEAAGAARAEWDMRFCIVPRHRYDALGAASEEDARAAFMDELARSPIGNGPFRFAGRSNGKIVVKRWDKYAGERPYVEQMVFHIVPDRDKWLRMLADGEADDVMLTADAFRWDANGASFSQHVIKVIAESHQYDYVCWNTDGSNAFFGDRNVRRAMTCALDLESMRQDCYGGIYPHCYGPFSYRAWNPTSGKPEVVPFDSGEAGRILDAEGWSVPASSADGVRGKNDQRFVFRLLVPKEALGIYQPALSIKQQLARIGVAVELDFQPWKECQRRMKAHDFEAFVGGVQPSPDPLGDAYRWKTGGPVNYGSYSNSEVDRLFEQALRTTDPVEQAEVYRQINRLIYSDQPYTFLWQKPTLWAFNKRIRGVEISPLGPVRFFPGPRAWWVAAAP